VVCLTAAPRGLAAVLSGLWSRLELCFPVAVSSNPSRRQP
jgi:hypothetical protein